MGRITAETKDTYQDAGYYLNERVGQFGIELSMEEELHGKWGSVTYEVDNASRIVREVERIPPINGNDVQLTIDLDQQQFAEQALETQLKRRQQAVAINPKDPDTNFEELVFPEYPREVNYKAPAGSVVVQNYENGQIIALASYPTFDNRWFEAGLTIDKFEQIFPSVDANGEPIDPDESILVNRAIQGRYNLGSTFKPFTAFAALDTGLLTPNDYYTDEGTYRMESVEEDKCNTGLVRCVYRNATCSGTGRPCVYGNVDVETALAVSSDTFFYRIGEVADDSEQLPADPAGGSRAVRFRCRDRDRLALRIRRHRPRRRPQGGVRRTGCDQRVGGLQLLHRRQRPARHRPGPAVGVAAATRGRVLGDREQGQSS